MRRVLFYTVFDVSPQKGGTERITETISRYLRATVGYKCYLSYSRELPDAFIKSNCFDGRLKLYENSSEKESVDFIISHRIDYIIVQGSYTIIPFFWTLVNKYKLQTKIIFVHHFNPGAEIYFNNFMTKWLGVRRGKSLKGKMKALLSIVKLPYTRLYYEYFVRHSYRNVYNMSDAVVLLSDKFIPKWMRVANIKDSSKFHVIHNSLTFDTFLTEHEIQAKKQEVLLVARLSEHQKRIKLALKIWKKIKQSSDAKDWILRIVGNGPWLEDYVDYVFKNDIDSVFFEGVRENVIDYYRNASIFLMTSNFEGWGLTLTESQQMGVIPIVFNSYESLTDIISDGFNGYIIENNDMNAFKDKVLYVMNNKEKRELVAINCIKSSKRFSIDIIGKNWMELMDKLG